MGIIKETVRKLRRNQTESEKIFWEMVRNRQFLGHKFLRQHPIKFEYEDRKHFFVADFYCAKKQLIVEIDGKIQDNQKDREYRTFLLNVLGYKVVRFKNEEVLDDLAVVLEKIKSYF